jgi:succinate dehydrogenase/fumarate reductase cytochrome b subunit
MLGAAEQKKFNSWVKSVMGLTIGRVLKYGFIVGGILHVIVGVYL